MLEWRQERPTERGRYLRNNPATHWVVPADLEFAEDTLRNYRVNIDAGGSRAISDHPDDWWWFGPIPDPPHWEPRQEELDVKPSMIPKTPTQSVTDFYRLNYFELLAAVRPLLDAAKAVEEDAMPGPVGHSSIRLALLKDLYSTRAAVEALLAKE